MTVWISQLHNEDRLAGTLSNLSRGPNPARIKFFTAPRPAGGGEATTLLATVTLDDPAGTVSGNKLVLSPPADALVQVAGTAAWARIEDGNGVASMDVDVSDMAGNGEIKLETVNLLAGGGIRIVLAEFG